MLVGKETRFFFQKRCTALELELRLPRAFSIFYLATILVFELRPGFFYSNQWAWAATLVAVSSAWATVSGVTRLTHPSHASIIC